MTTLNHNKSYDLGYCRIRGLSKKPADIFEGRFNSANCNEFEILLNEKWQRISPASIIVWRALRKKKRLLNSPNK